MQYCCLACYAWHLEIIEKWGSYYCFVKDIGAFAMFAPCTSLKSLSLSSSFSFSRLVCSSFSWTGDKTTSACNCRSPLCHLVFKLFLKSSFSSEPCVKLPCCDFFVASFLDSHISHQFGSSLILGLGSFLLMRSCHSWSLLLVSSSSYFFDSCFYKCMSLGIISLQIVGLMWRHIFLLLRLPMW